MSIIVVPAGYGAALAAAGAGTGAPGPARGLHRPVAAAARRARSTRRSARCSASSTSAAGRRSSCPSPQTVQTENLNAISYFVPSMLGLSIMQVGIFAAIPLVADREKLILKRLAATPLRRWQLVGSNVLMRLLIAFIQAIIIVAVGSLLFGVEIVGSLILVAAFVTLGAMAFLALGYVIASFAKTEDAANGMTSMIQFPMMFLSGTFFQIDQMPRVPPGRRPDHPADLPRGRAAPGHGRRRGVRAAVGLRRGAARLAGRLLRDRGAEVPLAVGRDRRRPAERLPALLVDQLVAASRRPPALGGRVRSVGSAG